MITVAEAKQRLADGTYDNDAVIDETVTRILNHFNPPASTLTREQALLIRDAYPDQFDAERWDMCN